MFARTRNGRSIPLDAEWREGVPQPVHAQNGNLAEVTDAALGAGASGLVVEVVVPNGTARWRAHFQTCPQASQWHQAVAR